MADQAQSVPQWDANKEPVTYQAPELPIINAEMVTFTVNQGGLIKLNFARLDNDIFGRAATLKPVPVAQIVMPLVSLVVLAELAEFNLKVAMNTGILSADHLKKVRDTVKAPLEAFWKTQEQKSP